MTSFLDILSTVLLIFSNPVTVFSLFLLGFFYYEKNTWGVAILLACFSMILNPALKEYFHMPRPDGFLGFGFPSGHFQGSMCFYGWLFIRTPYPWARVLIAAILASTGFALVQKGYHFPHDIAGAFISGSAVLVFAYGMLKRPPYHLHPEKLGYVLIGLSSVPLAYLIWQAHVQRHTLLGLGMLVVITWLWNRGHKKNSLHA